MCDPGLWARQICQFLQLSMKESFERTGALAIHLTVLDVER